MRRLSSRSTWLWDGELQSNTEIVGWYVPDGHPLKVGPHGIHLALIDADGRAVGAERLFGVIQGAEAVSVPIVGNLCVVVRGLAMETCDQGKLYHDHPR